MNIILFTEEEIRQAFLPQSDRRSCHITQVLALSEGDSFTMGVIDGPHGKGQLERKDENGSLYFSFELTAESRPLYPITLVVGLPRPQMAKRIMRDATTLGVERIVFFTSERGTKSYAQSPIFRPDSIRALLMEGAEQAVATRMPEIRLANYLKAALDETAQSEGSRVACDNEEATISLHSYAMRRPAPGEKLLPLVVVIGAERGFSHAERELMRSLGFTLANLGPRVLRTETACVTALSLLLAGAGYLM